MAGFLKRMLGKKEAATVAGPTEATTVEDLDPKKNAEQAPSRGGGAFVAFPIPDLPGGGSSADDVAGSASTEVADADALEGGGRALREQGYDLDREGGVAGEGGRALREEGYGVDREVGAQQVSAATAEQPLEQPIAEAPSADAAWSEADGQEALQQAAVEPAGAEQALGQVAQEPAGAAEALQTAQVDAEPDAAVQQAAEQSAVEGDIGPDVDAAAELPEFDEEPSTLLDMGTSTGDSPVLAEAGFDADDVLPIDEPDTDVDPLDL